MAMAQRIEPANGATADSRGVCGARAEDALRWLPRSCASRLVLALIASASLGLTFAAWLSPDMVFDFANLVFCG